MKKILIILGILGILGVYFIAIPYAMESKKPSVENYLKHEGYTDLEFKEFKTLSYVFVYGSDKGEVSVRVGKNGIMQVAY